MDELNEKIQPLLKDSLEKQRFTFSQGFLSAAKHPNYLRSDPLSEINRIKEEIENYYTRFPPRSERLEAIEGAAQDLLRCAEDPSFEIGKCAIITWDDPMAVMPRGFCFPIYNGEKVGPGRTWGEDSGDTRPLRTRSARG